MSDVAGPVRTWRRDDGHVVSTDCDRLDLDVIHGYLVRSYWSPGVARAIVAAAIRNSRCFGLYAPGGAQAGFARVVTDTATFAYLADVFVLEEHRGRGLGAWMAGLAVGDPTLAHLRRWMLVTHDAQTLYARFGFTQPEDPARLMLRPGPRPA